MSFNIPEALHARYGKRHLSYSSIKTALKDMSLFDKYMKREIAFSSDALVFGTMYDMLLFEPERAKATYSVVDEEKLLSSMPSRVMALKNPKASSDFREALALEKEAAESDGKILTTTKDFNQATAMIRRLDLSGLKSKYLSSGDYQVEFNTALGDVEVKGFLDCLGDGFIVDSKSTISITKFRYSVRDFSYDIQAYIYTKVFGIDKFYWLAQEKTDPYLPAIIECSEETLFNGEMKFNDGVERIRAFLENADQALPESDYLTLKI
jgi:hypothetical protein